jgi:hypothetical protein
MWRRRAAALCTAGLIAAAIVTPAVGDGPPAAKPSIWSLVGSPHLGEFNNIVAGMSGTGPGDVWAVGVSDGLAIVEHYDGASWSLVPGARVRGGGDQLAAVAALAPDDAWAVGDIAADAGETTLIEHWDGMRWKKVKAPNPGSHFGTFTGVTALAPNDIWAVGWFDSDATGTIEPLFAHYDGRRWTQVTVPSLGGFFFLQAVSAAAPNDIWAVGTDQSGAIAHTFAMHYDGRTWSVVPSDNAGAGDNALHSVVALPGGVVWAVGDSTPLAPPQDSRFQSLTERLVGGRLAVVPAVSPGNGDNHLFAVTALGPDSVWAAGSSSNFNTGAQSTLIQHWDGMRWKMSPAPTAGRSSTPLAITPVGPHELWVGGGFFVPGTPRSDPLFLHTTQG